MLTEARKEFEGIGSPNIWGTDSLQLRRFALLFDPHLQRHCAPSTVKLFWPSFGLCTFCARIASLPVQQVEKKYMRHASNSFLPKLTSFC
jgi:hypothetical protein